MKIKYVPIIKTGDAELRAVENLSAQAKEILTPLVELTRSRKSKYDSSDGDISRKLIRLKEVFGENPFILDLTTEPSLSNGRIDSLRSSAHAYKNWVEFMLSLKEEFPGIIPTIQISDDGVDSEKELYRRISGQVEFLDKHFSTIAYRFPLEYQSYVQDLNSIIQAISRARIIAIMDAEFIPQGKSGIYARKAAEVFQEIKRFCNEGVVLAATSFPRNPTEYGSGTDGLYPLEESSFFKVAAQQIGSRAGLILGDYATVNPVRNDQSGGNGWIPRIDMLDEEVIFYYRSRRTTLETTYASAYIRVAKSIVAHQRFKDVKKRIGSCWGIEQIESAAAGFPDGLSPSFWISVRMNIHMTLRASSV